MYGNWKVETEISSWIELVCLVFIVSNDVLCSRLELLGWFVVQSFLMFYLFDIVHGMDDYCNIMNEDELVK